MSADGLVEHFFRHEHGKLIATLVRRVGVRHIDAVEDAVQSALMTALERWKLQGLPDHPSAWLFRVAHNNLMGELRRGTLFISDANVYKRLSRARTRLRQLGKLPQHVDSEQFSVRLPAVHKVL